MSHLININYNVLSEVKNHPINNNKKIRYLRNLMHRTISVLFESQLNKNNEKYANLFKIARVTWKFWNVANGYCMNLTYMCKSIKIKTVWKFSKAKIILYSQVERYYLVSRHSRRDRACCIGCCNNAETWGLRRSTAVPI